MSSNTARPLFDDALAQGLRVMQPQVARGRVAQAFGTTLRVSGLQAVIGQQCLIRDPARPHATPLRAEVVGLHEHEAILVPLGHLQGISMGAEVEIMERASLIPMGEALLGRVLNAFGEPLDGQPLPASVPLRSFYSEPPNPLHRAPVDKPFITGVRAIDGLLTVGEGQRLGVFAMAGGGKSTLLGMLARQARSDINVIALVGERGREVREFLEESLGPEGMARSVVVVSTSDRPAMERLRAAQTATAIAEGFRAQGQRVLLMMDSVTRYARALREIGLSVGEPAVRRGFPPSVFAELPRLFERAGNDAHSSIRCWLRCLLPRARRRTCLARSKYPRHDQRRTRQSGSDLERHPDLPFLPRPGSPRKGDVSPGKAAGHGVEGGGTHRSPQALLGREGSEAIQGSLGLTTLFWAL